MDYYKSPFYNLLAEKWTPSSEHPDPSLIHILSFLHPPPSTLHPPPRSRAADQLYPVQLGARAPLRPAPGQRLCGGLGGPVRVQPRLRAARVQRHPLRERAREPGPVERHAAHLRR